MARPKKPETKDMTPEQKAVAALQYSMDRANAFIIDAPTTSIVARAARCAKRGVPRETVETALSAVLNALNEAREAVERVYEAPAPKKQVESRVNLLE